MTHLTMGANAPLSQNTFTVQIDFQGVSADVTALQLYDNDKVRGDADMCFFNQMSISGGALKLSVEGSMHSFEMDVARIPSDVQKIVFTAALETGCLSDVRSLSVGTTLGHMMDIPTQGRSERAVILAEVYKRNGQWKIRNVGQGFEGGLENLAEYFGVEIASSDPAPVPAPPAAGASLNLSKISLTKQESSLSLSKPDGRFGRIEVNLNWNQKKSGGFLGMGQKGIDLDLGCFIEFQNGQKTAVQALGNAFGDYRNAPFVQLQGDDRSGSVTDGEWLYINGDQWSQIKRVLIYAFIYEGVSNWQETDGYIRVMVPGQPEIEVRMNEVANSGGSGMCAVALLENTGGKIKVNREVRFFSGHSQMNDSYQWGLQFRAGRK